MPHIDLPEGLPGISAGFNFRPETAKPMRELAHILLHEPNSLTAGRTRTHRDLRLVAQQAPPFAS